MGRRDQPFIAGGGGASEFFAKPQAAIVRAASPGYNPCMKLAEALLERSDLQTKLASLRERVARNAVVQEGSAPHEEPAALIAEAVAVLDALEGLVARINATNAASALPDGRTLTAAIARREKLKQHHALLQSAIDGTHKEPDRYSMSEIKWVAALPVASLQRQADDLSRRIREMNVQIQAANWAVDVQPA